MEPKIILRQADFGWKFEITVDIHDIFNRAGFNRFSLDQKKEIIRGFLKKHQDIKKHSVIGDQIVFEGAHVNDDTPIKRLIDISNGITNLLYYMLEDYAEFKRKVQAVQLATQGGNHGASR